MDATSTEDGQPQERPHLVRRIGSVVLSVALLVALAAAGAVAVVPAITGADALTVLTGSMTPALPVGSVVVVRPTPPGEIAPGDVITYTDRDPDSTATRVVTHRVIGVEDGPDGLGFATQGDANNAPDPGLTAAADVIGVQWYSVPWVGTVRESLTGPVGLSYAVGILLLILSAHLLLPRTQTVRGAGSRTPPAEPPHRAPADAPTEVLPLVTTSAVSDADGPIPVVAGLPRDDGPGGHRDGRGDPHTRGAYDTSRRDAMRSRAPYPRPHRRRG